MNKALWVAALAGVVGLGMLIGTLDRQSADVTAKHERLAYERKADVKPEDRIALSHPLQGLWVEHCNPQDGCKRRYTSAGAK